MGSIMEMENGKFRVQMDVGKVNGKRKRNYLTASNLKEAKSLLNEFDYKKQRNLNVEPSKMTFSDLLNKWMDVHVKRKCEETTAYGYRNIINNHIIPYLGDIALQKIKSSDIDKYYDHLMVVKGLSPNTVHKHHANILKALKYGCKHELVYRNAAENVTLPKKIDFEGSYYTVVQVQELLAIVRGTNIELPVFIAILLGLRREEVMGLKWKNVDLLNRIVYIKEVRTSAGGKIVTKPPKNKNSIRNLYITDQLFEILIKHKSKQDEFKRILKNEYNNAGFVYSKDNGEPYRVNNITEEFTKFLAKHGLEKIRFHDLRHTWASILYDEGVDLKAISEGLGHSDLATTNKVYAHRFDKTHKKTVNVMSKVLSR
jgi:integrase